MDKVQTLIDKVDFAIRQLKEPYQRTISRTTPVGLSSNGHLNSWAKPRRNSAMVFTYAIQTKRDLSREALDLAVGAIQTDAVVQLLPVVAEMGISPSYLLRHKVQYHKGKFVEYTISTQFHDTLFPEPCVILNIFLQLADGKMDQPPSPSAFLFRPE